MKKLRNMRKSDLIYDRLADRISMMADGDPFPSVREFGMTSEEFARRLLEEKRVAVVPGSAFGACGEGFLRISYAYSVSDLKRALALIEEFVNDLRKSGAKG